MKAFRTLQFSWDLWAYAALLVIAGVLRFGGLTLFPYSLWVDEAWFGLKGREVLQGLSLLPLQEPIHLGVGISPFQIYAAMLVQALGFPAAYSSRIASAVVGSLAVALLYPLLCLIFKELLPAAFQRLAALMSIAAFATHLASVLFSRDGGQNAACVFATVVTFGGLYATFAYASWRWAIFTGAALALALTTYEASVATLLVCGLYSGLRLWQADANARRMVLRLSGLLFGSLVVVFAPLLVFYLLHPAIYFLHFFQTQSVADADSGNTVVKALTGLWQVFLGISVRGDALPGRNVSGRPFFDAAASVVLWVGMALLWWRARQPGAQLLLLWVGVFMLPSALTSDAPGFPRILPMAPGLAACVGLGYATLWQWLTTHVPKWRWVGGALLLLMFIAGSLTNIYDYFWGWNGNPHLYDARYMGARQTADNALALLPTDTVFITTKNFDFVQMQFELLLGHTPVKLFDATPLCLPYVHNAPRPTAYGIVTVADATSLDKLKAAYPTGDEVRHAYHPAGYAYSLFFQVPPHTPAPSPSHAVAVRFDGGVQLVGYDVQSTWRASTPLTLTLYWEADGPLARAMVGFVHIGKGDTSDPMIAQQDAPLCPGFPTLDWQPGYRYIETRVLTFADAVPPDAYDIRVGVYQPQNGVRLNVLSADVPTENNRVILFPFEVR